MSRCDEWLEALIDRPEMIHDREFQDHANGCPSCQALDAGLLSATGGPDRGMDEDLTCRESSVILDSLKASLKRGPVRKRSSFRIVNSIVSHPVLASSVAAAVLILLAVIVIVQPFPAGTPELVEEVSSTRHMKIVIQVDGQPPVEAYLEYTPETGGERSKEQ